MKERNVTEAQVRNKLLRGLAIRRLRVKKVEGWRGWPDEMVLYPGGVTDWIELKRPKGGKYEPLQLRVHAMLRGLGFNVYVIVNYEQVDNYLQCADEYLRSRSESPPSRTHALRQARRENAS
jgi:hypothetical protein